MYRFTQRRLRHGLFWKVRDWCTDISATRWVHATLPNWQEFGAGFGGFDPTCLVYLMPRRGKRGLQRDVRFFRLCGIRRFVGLPIGDLGEHWFDEKAGLWEQEAARLLRSVRSLGDADINDLRWWDLRLTEAERQKAQAVLQEVGDQPLVACGPGTKMQANDWGQDNWRALLDETERGYA